MAASLSYLYPAWEGDVVVHVDLRHHTLAVGEYLVYRLHSFAVFLTTLRGFAACMVLVALRALRLFEARCDNNLNYSSLVALRALRLSRRGVTIICFIHR